MGNLATPEFLIARWGELCRDPSLENLPSKIELNAWGKVEISPARVSHAWLQAALATQLNQQQHAGLSPLRRAPEICIEVTSPSNVEAESSEKTAAYFAAGAEEVWIVAENGTIRYLNASGEAPRSRFPAAVTLPDPTKGYP